MEKQNTKKNKRTFQLPELTEKDFEEHCRTLKDEKLGCYCDKLESKKILQLILIFNEMCKSQSNSNKLNIIHLDDAVDHFLFALEFCFQKKLDHRIDDY